MIDCADSGGDCGDSGGPDATRLVTPWHTVKSSCLHNSADGNCSCLCLHGQ